MEPELKAELMQALRALREPADERSKREKWLNSPFTVTLIGGIILALTSGVLTNCSADAAKERDLAVEKLRQRQAFVDTFTTRIEQYFELTLSVRKREIYLFDSQKVPEQNRGPYGDGRNFVETRNQYEADKKFWLSHSSGSPTALICTAKILFNSAEVRKRLDAIDAAADRYGIAGKQKDLDQAYNDALQELENAALAMANETHEK